MDGRLVPEKRRDKTGRLVTRWVLPSGPGQPGKEPLPGPAVPQQPVLSEEDADRCRAAIRAEYGYAADAARRYGMDEVGGLAPLKDLSARLDQLSPNVVAAFSRAMRTRPEMNWGVLLLSILNAYRTSRDAGHLLAIVLAEDAIDTDWGDKGTGCWTYEYAEKIRQGMDHLRAQRLPIPADAVDADGTCDPRITALTTLTIWIAGADVDKAEKRIVEVATNAVDMIYLRPRGAVRLVLERPEAAADIARVWAPRRDLDAAGISQMLDLAVPLQEGAL